MSLSVLRCYFSGKRVIANVVNRISGVVVVYGMESVHFIAGIAGT